MFIYLKTKFFLIILFLIVLFFNASFAKEIKIELSLKEYLKEVSLHNNNVLLNNFDIDITRASYHERRDQLKTPFIDGVFNRNFDVTPIEQRNENLNFGLQSLIVETGATVRLEINNRYGINIDSGAFSSIFSSLQSGLGAGPGGGTSQIGTGFDEEWTSSFGLDIQQPLLRGGPIGFGNVKELNILKDRVKLERATYNLKLNSLILEALSLYWQLKINKDNLTLAKEALEDTRRLLKLTRKKVALGTSDVGVLYNLEALMAEGEEEILLIKKDIHTISMRLALFMGEDITKNKDYQIIIKDDFVFKEEAGLEKGIEVYKKTIYKRSLKERADMVQAKLVYKVSEDTLALSKLNIMPLLNVQLKIDYAARGDQLGKAISDSLENLGEYNFYFGLRFEVPLYPQAFLTAFERAEHDFKKKKKQLENLKKNVYLEINERVGELNHQWFRVSRYSEIVSTMKKRLFFYQQDFRIGRVNLDQLTEAYNSLRNWQKKYLRSVFQYEVAKANLKISQGILLKFYDIKVKNVKKNVR